MGSPAVRESVPLRSPSWMGGWRVVVSAGVCVVLGAAIAAVWDYYPNDLLRLWFSAFGGLSLGLALGLLWQWSVDGWSTALKVEAGCLLFFWIPVGLFVVFFLVPWAEDHAEKLRELQAIESSDIQELLLYDDEFSTEPTCKLRDGKVIDGFVEVCRGAVSYSPGRADREGAIRGRYEDWVIVGVRRGKRAIGLRVTLDKEAPDLSYAEIYLGRPGDDNRNHWYGTIASKNLAAWVFEATKQCRKVRSEPAKNDDMLPAGS